MPDCVRQTCRGIYGRLEEVTLRLVKATYYSPAPDLTPGPGSLGDWSEEGQVGRAEPALWSEGPCTGTQKTRVSPWVGRGSSPSFQFQAVGKILGGITSGRLDKA